MWFLLVLLLVLFHRQIRLMLSPLVLRLWLWSQPATRYGAKQARILAPVLRTAQQGQWPVLLAAQGLGAFARVCRDPEALATVWLEGLVRAMLQTDMPASRVHLPLWGPAATHAARIFERLTGQLPWHGTPGEFACMYGSQALVTFPWDPLSQIGNEWWCGMWATSGDPATACNTNLTPTARVDGLTPWLHVHQLPPFLGGEATYQLMKWQGGTAVPLMPPDMTDQPEAAIQRYFLHTLTKRASITCHRFSAMVVLDADTAPAPPQWTIKWSADSGVTVTSHVPRCPAADEPRNTAPGHILTHQHQAAEALWHKRPPAVLGIGNDCDGMQRLVLWHEESGPKLMLVPYEDWDEFALQFDMPLQNEVDEVLSECSYLQPGVTFHSEGCLHHQLPGCMDEPPIGGSQAHLAAVPGIALEHYDALAASLLEPDLTTFRRV